MYNEQRVAGSSQAHNGKTVPAAFAVLALLCSVAALAGWLYGLPDISGFGFDEYPVWPLTATGYTFLSLGYVAMVFGWKRAAAACLAVPLLLALVTIYQSVTGSDIGVDRILFGAELDDYPFTHPGRPGANAVVNFLLLAIGAYGSRIRSFVPIEIANLMAVVVLGLSAAAAAMILLSSEDISSPQILHISLPAAISAMSLATAFLFLQQSPSWVRLVEVSRRNPRLIQTLVACGLVLPMIPALMELLVVRHVMLSPIASGLLIVSFNIMVVSFIAYWAVTRVAREQAAMAELSHALDYTTVILTDADGRILHWSLGCQQLYGWSAAEAQGQIKYALLRARCYDSNGGKPRQTVGDAQELIEIRKDGMELCILERVNRVTSPHREPILVHSITDVSQRVAALRALRTSEERLALAAGAHELGVFEWDVATGRFEWSPGTEQRLGMVPGSLGDFESWRSRVEPADVQDILDTMARAVANRADKFSFRYRFLQPNGAVRAVEGSSRAFYDEQGNLIRTVGVILDITEREEREAALRRREAQLRTVLETVPDAMVVVNESGTILQFSAAAEKLWGYRAIDVIDQSFTMLSPADARAANADLLQKFVETSGGIIDEVLTGTGETADGRRFPLEARAGVAKSDGQTLLTIFVRDLSERIAAEERLSELSSEIAHVSRQSAMSELAADLAHELNQPLSATSNFLAAARMLIERGEPAERVSELLRTAIEQTQRAGEIIRRLRAFMARGEVEMRVESVERTVRDAVDLILVGTSQFNTRVNYQLDPKARFILADRIQVQQVLVNLLRNAMEALRGSGRNDRQITISSCKYPDQMVEIAVTDSGPGLPEHVLETLFSRFTTTKGSGGGMGIGLSISKRIIEAHGGTLSAGNQPGGGASFRFTLPAVEEGGVE
ncbi:MAG: PAS domain S-box protein [Sphingomonas sp.]